MDKNRLTMTLAIDYIVLFCILCLVGSKLADVAVYHSILWYCAMTIKVVAAVIASIFAGSLVWLFADTMDGLRRVLAILAEVELIDDGVNRSENENDES